MFNLEPLKLSYTEQYKYLGLTLDEHLTFDEAVSVLAQSAGRALGSIMNKVKHCGNLGFNTYTQLYESGVCPVSDYACGVWGFREHTSCNTVHRAVQRPLRGQVPKAHKRALLCARAQRARKIWGFFFSYSLIILPSKYKLGICRYKKHNLILAGALQGICSLQN